MSGPKLWPLSSSHLDNLSIPDIIAFTRSFYLLSALSILLVRFTPVLRDRFLEYGARSNQGGVLDASTTRSRPSNVWGSPIIRVLDHLASWRVSHSYFLIFYVASSILSVYWLYNTYSDESLFKTRCIGPEYALFLITLHSFRRLYENTFIVVPNAKSTMWMGHFVIGLMFYMFVHIAIIAEYTGTEQGSSAELSPRILLATLAFTLASIWQHKYHRYLSSLIKYTLPEQYGASHIVAPHYTAECLLYLCLAILTAKDGEYLNSTLLCVLIFVVVNLGVTADGTKTWQLNKFRDRRREIQKRSRMLYPFF